MSGVMSGIRPDMPKSVGCGTKPPTQMQRGTMHGVEASPSQLYSSAQYHLRGMIPLFMISIVGMNIDYMLLYHYEIVMLKWPRMRPNVRSQT